MANKIQFSLKSGLAFLGFSTFLLGVSKALAVGPAFAVFGIALLAIMLLASALMTGPSTEWISVRKLESDTQAAILRDFLRTHGVPSRVLATGNHIFGGTLNQWMIEVLVLPADLEKAEALIEESFHRLGET